MKRLIYLLCTLIVTSVTYASATAHPLEFLYGKWAGVGKTNGLAANLTLVWQPALEGRFTTIHLHNEMSAEDGEQLIFEGIGYYRETGEGNFTGVWIDSLGQIHPLNATLETRKLITTWGSADSELGRSIYRLLPSGILDVEDSIMNDEGAWRVFGQSILTRVDNTPNNESEPSKYTPENIGSN